MQSYAKVISGTEGSEDANAAVRLAGRLSAKMGVPLDLVVAYDDDSGRDSEWAKATLEKAAQLATEGGATTIEPRIASGKADEVLINAGEATPDALIVVGDDQKELFDTDNLPSILVYHGATMRNVPLGAHPGPDWARAASHANPILYMVSAFRFGFLGTTDVDLRLAYGIMIGAAVFMYTLAVILLNRGSGIRD